MAPARVVEPEWLDELPPDNPRAMRSRRDLVRINALMGNVGIVARELARSGEIRSIAEIGGGDGSFLRKVIDATGGGNVKAFVVDRQPVCTARGVVPVTADVFDWLADPAAPRVDAIVANLFLHHFESHALSRMLSLVARRARVFVACEPRRSRTALLGARLLGFVGCNDVSRHDAVVSVHAGFTDGEISDLWPADDKRPREERARGLFSHSFAARADA